MSDWATLASAVAAIAAAILAGLALIANNRSAEAAKRSAAAAEVAVNLAMEVRWSVARVGNMGGFIRLTNQGRKVAYRVSVQATGLSAAGASWDDIGGNESMDFMQATAMGQKDRTMTVTWHLKPDGSDEPQTWRHPLP